MRSNVLCSWATMIAIAAADLTSVGAPAQIIDEQRVHRAAITDQDLMRLDLRAQRSELIAANMNLTPAQMELFIPIYLEFDLEVQNLWNERLKLMARYATEFQTITDEQVDSLASTLFDLDDKHVKIRKKYYREFKAALGAKVAARFMQLDRRLNSLLELQAAQSIPLVK